MKSELTWRSKYTFDGKVRGHDFVLDVSTPAGGGDHGPSPKELLLASICGCTGMDVVGIMRKSKIELSSLKVSAEAETGQQHPKTFKEVKVFFHAEGPAEAKAALIDAVEKSQTLYCGVSAMIAKSCDIVYQIKLNGELIHEGKADFPV